jgi:1-deoxy-D-xylulose-5-phosphate synthase
LRQGKDLTILALGTTVYPSMDAAAILEKEGLSVGVVNCRFVKPIDVRLADLASSTNRVLVVEENIRQGGFGGAVLELFSDLGLSNVRVKRIGLPDKFVEHGPPGLLKEKCGLDTSGIMKEAKNLIGY